MITFSDVTTDHTDMTATILQMMTNLGFAGLVWYLLAYRDPIRDRAMDAERERWLTRMEAHDQMFRDTIRTMTDEFTQQVQLNTVALRELSEELRKSVSGSSAG